MKTVVVDPGHGGDDSGAVGQGRTEEADVVLTVGKTLHKMFNAHPKIFAEMTRPSDAFMTLAGRASLANHLEADLFISLHCNASPNHDARGFEVWTSPGQTDSDRAATAAFNRYHAAFPQLRARVGLGDGDPDKEAKFTVLVRTKGPAILFELEFIDHPEGEEFLLLTDPEDLARPLYLAALEFLGFSTRLERLIEASLPAPVDKAFVRLKQEREEVTDRFMKLERFMQSDAFFLLRGAEQSRLRRQQRIMDLYLTVLTERIADCQ